MYTNKHLSHQNPDTRREKAGGNTFNNNSTGTRGPKVMYFPHALAQFLEEHPTLHNATHVIEVITKKTTERYTPIKSDSFNTPSTHVQKNGSH